jgi:hypothetical protein
VGKKSKQFKNIKPAKPLSPIVHIDQQAELEKKE